MTQEIQNLANKVRNERYGKDVREAIARSMEVTGETAEDAKNRSIEQTERVDTLIRENPQPSEVVDARLGHPTLRDNLNSINQNLAQKATNEELDELADVKADKAALAQVADSKRDKDVEIGMADLDQEVREAFTGGAVPVVGENSVGTDNLRDGAVSTEKLDKEILVKDYISDETYDLDYVWETGSYVVNMNAKNVPTDSSGTLDVVRHKTALGGATVWITQTFSAYSLSSEDRGKTFRRIFSVIESEGSFVFKGDWFQLSAPDKITNEMLDNDLFIHYPYLSDETYDLDRIWDQGNYIVNESVKNNPYQLGSTLEVERFKTVESFPTVWVTQEVVVYSAGSYRGRVAKRILYVDEDTNTIHYKSEWSDGWEEPIKILTIGNSFGLDATRYIPWISQTVGINVMVGNLYISGGLFSDHDSNIKNNTKAYRFYRRYHIDGSITNDYLEDFSVDDALGLEEWDYVFFNQGSAQSGVYESFQPYLNDIISHVKNKQPNIKIAFMPTWAYSSDFDDSRFDKYDRNQLTMYNNIMEAYKSAMSEVEFDAIIPVGTAIQNARTDNYMMGIERELTRDGYHLSDAGGFIACVTLFKTLVDDSVDIDYAPSAIDKRAAYFGKVAAENAMLNPFQITEI